VSAFIVYSNRFFLHITPHLREQAGLNPRIIIFLFSDFDTENMREQTGQQYHILFGMNGRLEPFLTALISESIISSPHGLYAKNGSMGIGRC
jgi:hypothetical protein